MPTPPHPPARGSVASPYGARADPEDSHTPGRTARAATTFAGTGPAYRLGLARADPRRASHLSSVARRAARDRHPQSLTGVGHEASKRRDRQTGTRSAPTHEKRHCTGVRGVLANRHRTADTPHLAVQGQSVSRKTVAEVPLTGLSLDGLGRCPVAARCVARGYRPRSSAAVHRAARIAAVAINLTAWPSSRRRRRPRRAGPRSRRTPGGRGAAGRRRGRPRRRTSRRSSG